MIVFMVYLYVIWILYIIIVIILYPILYMYTCLRIVNLSNKRSLNCSKSFNTQDDIIRFLKRAIPSQTPGDAFAYIFDNGSRHRLNYLTVNAPDAMIEPINDMTLKIIEKLLVKSTKEEVMDSIILNIKKIMQMYNIDEQLDESKTMDMLNRIANREYVIEPEMRKQLENDIKTIETQKGGSYDKSYETLDEYKQIEQIKPVQKGGVLIWMLEKYVFSRLPEQLENAIYVVLEIIDIILIVLSSVPGFLPADIAALIYSFLRFDIIGMLGALCAFIPGVGDALGGVVRILNKMRKYSGVFIVLMVGVLVLIIGITVYFVFIV